MIVAGLVKLKSMEKWYKRGLIDKGEFRELAVKYIEQGVDIADRYMRACEVDVLAEEMGI